MSLLLRRPPGREAYPGDVFYLHSPAAGALREAVRRARRRLDDRPADHRDQGQRRLGVHPDQRHLDHRRPDLPRDRPVQLRRPAGDQRRHLGVPGRWRGADQGDEVGRRPPAPRPRPVPRAGGVRRVRLRPGQGVARRSSSVVRGWSSCSSSRSTRRSRSSSRSSRSGPAPPASSTTCRSATSAASSPSSSTTSAAAAQRHLRRDPADRQARATTRSTSSKKAVARVQEAVPRPPTGEQRWSTRRRAEAMDADDGRPGEGHPLHAAASGRAER